MIFEQENLKLDIIDVFDLDFKNDFASVAGRNYCALSLRTYVEGNTEITFGDKTYLLKTGDISFFPANTPYIRKTVNEKLIVFHFQIEKDYTKEFFTLHSPASSKIHALFDEGYFESIKKTPGYKYRLNSILYSIFAEFCSSEKKLSKTLEEGLAYIRDNYYSKSFCIEDISRNLNICDSYLRKIFYKELGLSPKKYCDNLRFERAVSLLCSGYLSISEIADYVGFSDAKHFSTAFRKRFGCSPSDYKANLT